MLFLAGNSIKALGSAATLAVLDPLNAITSRCQMPKLRDLKKREGGNNGNLNVKSAKETMLSEIRVSGWECLLSLVVVLYTLVSFSECQRSTCVASAGQSAVYLYKAPKRILWQFFTPLRRQRVVFSESSTNEDTINNYGESSVMTWRRRMPGYTLWKLAASKANCAQTERLRLKTV